MLLNRATCHNKRVDERVEEGEARGGVLYSSSETPAAREMRPPCVLAQPGDDGIASLLKFDLDGFEDS